MRWSTIWALMLSLFVAATARSVTLLHEFNGLEGAAPFAEVLLVDDTIFGTTSLGGVDGDGIVYRVKTDGTGFQVLHDFGVVPGDGEFLLGGLVFDGTSLYGTTSQAVFSIEPDSTNYRVLTRSVSSSDTGLALESTTLYGFSRGAVFSIETDGSGFKLLYELESRDGSMPWGTPAISNGRLYGTTSSGGPGRRGTIFAVDLDGSNFEVLHAFDGFTGAQSGAGLEIVDGRMYGTTRAGGPNNRGVVFAIDSDGSDFEILHAFSGSDGFGPGGGVTVIGDEVFGSTFYGGQHGAGTLFSLGINGAGFRTVHNFSGAPTDGANPLPQAGFAVTGNVLYGTSQWGGEHDAGTVYSFFIPEPSTLSLLVLCLLAMPRHQRRFDL